jgi:hypothetical protein
VASSPVQREDQNKPVVPASTALTGRHVKWERAAPAPYAFPTKALERWSKAFLTVEKLPPRGIEATFQFDGKTCTGGDPLHFVFTVTLRASGNVHMITRAL